MWNDNSNSGNPPVENLDNYISSIERAKAELELINKDISDALSRKSDLIAGNDTLFKEKLADIEHQREGIEGAQALITELSDKNNSFASELKEREQSLLSESQDLESKNLEFMKMVQQKSSEFESREQDIKRVYDAAHAKMADADKAIKDNAEILERIESEKKAAQELSDKAASDKLAAEQSEISSQKALADAVNLRSDAETIKQDAQKSLQISQENLIAADEKNKEADASLQKALKESDAINDKIIESKRAKVEALKLTEAAQITIAEANQKIAALTELKAELAKQEK